MKHVWGKDKGGNKRRAAKCLRRRCGARRVPGPDALTPPKILELFGPNHVDSAPCRVKTSSGIAAD